MKRKSRWSAMTPAVGLLLQAAAFSSAPALAASSKTLPARARRVDESAGNRGEYLFRTQCASCHTIGHGDGLGPDLLGVAEVRDKSWITRFVADPDEMLASGDRLAMGLFEKYARLRMPNLHLGAADVHALIDFLEVRSLSSHAVAATEARPNDAGRAAEPASGAGGLQK